jgi:hypothetical protein
MNAYVGSPPVGGGSKKLHASTRVTLAPLQRTPGRVAAGGVGACDAVGGGVVWACAPNTACTLTITVNDTMIAFDLWTRGLGENRMVRHLSR